MSDIITKIKSSSGSVDAEVSSSFSERVWKDVSYLLNDDNKVKIDKALKPNDYQTYYINGEPNSGSDKALSYAVDGLNLVHIVRQYGAGYDVYTFLDKDNEVLDYKPCGQYEYGDFDEYVVVPDGAKNLILSSRDTTATADWAIKAYSVHLAPSDAFNLVKLESVPRLYNNVFYVRRQKVVDSSYDDYTYGFIRGAKYIYLKGHDDGSYPSFTITDADGNVLDYKTFTKSGDSDRSYEEFVKVPDNAEIVYTGNKHENQKKYSRIYVATTDGGFAYNRGMFSLKREIHGVIESGAYTNETYYGADSGERHVKFDVSSFERVLIVYNKDTYYNVYTFLDDENNIIAYEENGSDESDSEISQLIVRVPNGAKYLCVSCNRSHISNVSLYVSDQSIVSVSDSAFNLLSGKKIAWFGTSIPAGGYIGSESADTYPKRIADILGCTVYNEAVGSSTVHCRSKSLESEENPYGFISDYANCSRCLGNTVEEMQWLIDHYDSPIFTLETVSSMTEELKSQILSFGYEQKIDKYLKKENEPDLWVFDHGYNDKDSGGDPYSDQDPQSVYNFRGRMNFLISRILSFNPHARIVIIGHYENQINTGVVKNQMEVADDWSIPIFRAWEVYGWSDKSIKTTGGWENGFWVEDLYSDPVSITVRDCFLADHIHPHSDKSGKTLGFIASCISSWIRDITAW